MGICEYGNKRGKGTVEKRGGNQNDKEISFSSSNKDNSNFKLQVLQLEIKHANFFHKT